MGTGQELRSLVLVVDDDPQVRALTARALADDGFAVLEAANAVHALALLQGPASPNVRLVITDIRMPGMNGDDLGRLLHQRRPTLPVLYMSGFAEPALDFLSPTEVARCWLSKPFNLAELVTKVRGACDGAHSPP